MFAYLGVSSIYYLLSQPICWSFLVAEIFIVIIGRFLAVFIAYYAFQCFPGSPKNNMTVNQLAFLAFAALIRGSIAFGLILKMDSDFSGLGFTVFTDGQVKVIKSTTSALVILTTIVFGAFTNFA